MQRLSFIIVSLILSQFVFGKNFYEFNLTTKIINQKKAKKFDSKYLLFLPCHNYNNALNLFIANSMDTTLLLKKDESYLVTSTIYGKMIENIGIKKSHLNDNFDNSILGEIWLTPLYHDNNGYIFIDNNKIISKRYNSNTTKQFSIGKKISSKIDRHCFATLNDTTYYYTTADYNRKKNLFGKDTTVVDFDFYEWNSLTDTTLFLFSASKIIPDSMVVPELSDDPERGIYAGLDIYHWNWVQKTQDNKLLINFAYTGFMQVDLSTKKTDWYWGNNGHSFSKIKGVGDLKNPYYTHHINIINSGPYKGYYSYFENGMQGDSAEDFRPAKARIFKINPKDNSLEVVFEKVFDISSVALGSIDVSEDFVVVNLGMIIPVKEIMQLMMKTSSKSETFKFWENYKHPVVYVFDLKGNEISNYTYPFKYFSYAAWSKKK